jgi:hypothetical protein
MERERRGSAEETEGRENAGKREKEAHARHSFAPLV